MVVGNPYLDQLEARSEWSTKFSSATNIDKTLKENNLFYGFVRDKADVKYCQCIVHEPLIRVTRTAPLVYVAHIPNEKFAGQTLEQVSKADTEVYAWMQEVRLLGHDLSFWDSGSIAKNLRRPSSFNP